MKRRDTVAAIIQPEVETEVKSDTVLAKTTGVSDSVDSETARAAGVRGFVMKPLVKRELALAARKALNTRDEA